MAVIVLLITRTLRPLRQLAEGVWDDWTQLTFGLYGIMPLITFVMFDEVADRFQLPFQAGLTLVLCAGALAYMHSVHAGARALSLLVGTVLAWGLATVGTAIYWGGRIEPWMRGPPDHWQDIVRRSAVLGAIFLAVLFAPVLVGAFHRSLR